MEKDVFSIAPIALWPISRFSADGHLVATTTANMMVEVWDATLGTCSFILNDAVMNSNVFFRSHSCSAVFSASSMFIADSSDNREVWVWNIHTRSLVKSIYVGRNVDQIAVSSDGSRLASVSRSDITIWDLAVEKPIARLKNSFQSSVAFSVDRNTILIKNHDHIDHWRITPTPSPGPFDLPMIFVHILSKPWHNQSHSYYPDSEWILSQNKRRMLWLPPNKRARTTDSHRRKIAIVSQDGKWYIVDFSNILLL